MRFLQTYEEWASVRLPSGVNWSTGQLVKFKACDMDALLDKRLNSPSKRKAPSDEGIKSLKYTEPSLPPTTYVTPIPFTTVHDCSRSMTIRVSCCLKCLKMRLWDNHLIFGQFVMN